MAIDKDSYLSWLGFETMWKKITNSFAKKSTTISGYGITDAYTKTEVNNQLNAKANTYHTHTSIGTLNTSVAADGNNVIVRDSNGIQVFKTLNKFNDSEVLKRTGVEFRSSDDAENEYTIGEITNKRVFFELDNAGINGGLTINSEKSYLTHGGNSVGIFDSYVNLKQSSNQLIIDSSRAKLQHDSKVTLGIGGVDIVNVNSTETVLENAQTKSMGLRLRPDKSELKFGGKGLTITSTDTKLSSDTAIKIFAPDVIIGNNDASYIMEIKENTGVIMNHDIDMTDNYIQKCGELSMNGDIIMGANSISNCQTLETTQIDGCLGQKITFGNEIYANDGFNDGTNTGKATDLVQGNGKFRKITDEIDTGDNIYIHDERIPSSEAVYDYVENRISGTIHNIVNTSYSNLKTLRDGGKLRAGQWYRITDFVTTCNYTYAQSAGHAFDILVFATSTATLSETAFAIHNANDTYFTNRKLGSWELRYCLDNDRTRFTWANTTTGKGVIYYMKDEYNNEAPYDFKNIQFRDYLVNETANTPANVYKAVGNDGSSKNMNLLLSFNSAYRYTFATTSGTDSSLTGGARNNRIEPYFNGSMMHLNFITMSSSSIYGMNFGKNCHHITIETSSSLSDTAFNGINEHIYIKCKSFYDNIFDKGAYQISICGNYASSSSSNIWANYFGSQSAYIALVLQSHVRCLNFMSRNQNICLYGVSAQCIQFGEQAMYISWIEQATFAAAKASASFTNTPSRLSTTGYFLYNRFMTGSEGISIGIPFLFSCDFGGVKYMALNKQSSATYSFETPTHWLDVSVGDYGSSSAYKVITPPNNSTSQVFMRKTNYQTLNY